MQAIERETLDR